MEIILRLCSKFVIGWFRGNKCSRFLGSAALLGRGEWDDSGTLWICKSNSPTNPPAFATRLQIFLLISQVLPAKTNYGCSYQGDSWLIHKNNKNNFWGRDKGLPLNVQNLNCFNYTSTFAFLKCFTLIWIGAQCHTCWRNKDYPKPRGLPRAELINDAMLSQHTN